MTFYPLVLQFLFVAVYILYSNTVFILLVLNWIKLTKYRQDIEIKLLYNGTTEVVSLVKGAGVLKSEFLTDKTTFFCTQNQFDLVINTVQYFILLY